MAYLHGDEPVAAMIELARLREVAALAHGVEGVSVVLRNDAGDDLLVAARRAEARLSPCVLRSLVAERHRRPESALLRRVVGADVVGGLEHLGGGVWGRRWRGAEERWLTTQVDHQRVLDILGGAPVDVPHDGLSAAVRVDTELQTTLVCFTADHESYTWRLDEVAVWAQGALLVAELTATCEDAHR